MRDPRTIPWREDVLPRVVAALGAMVLLALAWQLAGGITRFVLAGDGGQSQRIRIAFSAREPDVVPPPPSLPAPSTPPPAPGASNPPPMPRRDPTAPSRPPMLAAPPASDRLFDEDGRPRLPDGESDRWNRAPAGAPGSVDAAPADPEALRRLTERPNPVEYRGTRFAEAWKSDGDLAEVTAQQIARAQTKIAEFLFGKDIQHARARPSPDIAFNPRGHSQAADLGSEATGDAYKSAPIAYLPAPGMDGEASRRIREQVVALETGYAHCDRARLRTLMQPLLLHLDELQKAETAYARGADPVRAGHILPNTANNAYDMARRALWYADSRMAGCGG